MLSSKFERRDVIKSPRIFGVNRDSFTYVQLRPEIVSRGSPARQRNSGALWPGLNPGGKVLLNVGSLSESVSHLCTSTSVPGSFLVAYLFHGGVKT